ncbi:hypothetical protein SSX86_003550 [Deinandra increscens subsp. villosa]|uniref:F-box domain-containing protein n=1 Tax=Deinandra increscens subsp. villosa TaxID=3103831 RepID=A0AAP0DHV1_9ASTR
MTDKRAKIKITETIIDNTEALTTESTQSGAIIGSNDDLLTEILLRLPAAHVLRFKSVSKHWQSFLSHRRFTLPYDNVPVSPGLFVRNLYIPFDVETRIPPPFRSLNFYAIIVVSKLCNLVTVYYFVVVIEGENVDADITCLIPPLGNLRSSHRSSNVRMLITRSFSWVWHFIKQNVFVTKLYVFKKQVVTRIYFTSKSTRLKPESGGFYKNLTLEKAHMMLLPERASSARRARRPLYFGESRGHLHLVKVAHHESPLHLNVYEMLADYSGWLMKYCVELDQLPTAYPDMVYSIRDLSNYLLEIFDVLRGGGGKEEEITFMVARIPRKIMRYNVVTKSLEKIMDMPTRICYQRICYTNVHRYTSTLSYF